MNTLAHWHEQNGYNVCFANVRNELEQASPIKTAI